MMKTIKRTAALLLAMVMLLLCACAGEKKQQQKVIGTCAGVDVLYEELRCITLFYKDILETTYGKGIWDDPATAEQYRAELEEAVWTNIRNNYAVIETCRRYAGLSAEDVLENEEIKAAVDADIEADIKKKYGSKKEFRKALAESYMTENFWRFTNKIEYIKLDLMSILSEDMRLFEHDLEAFLSWLEQGNCVYVQHVFIENDEGEDVAANRALAEQTREKLANGTPIGDIINSAVNEDLQNVAPYYIVREVYTEAMETAAFSLTEAGDVSQVVETETGFFILVRMEEDEAALVLQANNLFWDYKSTKTQQYIDSCKADLTVELNEYGKSIDLLAIK